MTFTHTFIFRFYFSTVMLKCLKIILTDVLKGCHFHFESHRQFSTWFFLVLIFSIYFIILYRVVRPSQDPCAVRDDICIVQGELFFKRGHMTIGWCCRSEKCCFLLLVTIFIPVDLLDFLRSRINNNLFNFELFLFILIH